MNRENKILIAIVDDEPEARDLFKDLFASKGYEVEIATGGIEALEMIDKILPDAILLDIRMPGMDGIEVLSKIKQKKPNIPVVMLTAYGYYDDLINEAVQLGAAGYISKNLPLAQIVHTFQTLLSTLPKKDRESTF